MSFLNLEGISKHYGDFAAVVDTTLHIEQGEFVSLLGPSGCGKTTTLQMVAGFVQPTKGQIILDGRDITQVKPSQRGLGIVFQSYALFPHMTVSDNVAFGLEMRGIPAAERRKRVKSTLKLVHLEPLANRYPRELSGGQRQRVALARALAIQPPVLLLDEPMGALDAKLREDMQIELRALQHSVGVTTIMVTHDQAEAMTLSDRVVLMNQGEIEQVDQPVDMYERPSGRFSSTFLGKANVFDGVRKQANEAFEIQGLKLPSNDTGLGDLTYIIRPEKINFSNEDAILSGTVNARVFLGNHWLYQVETKLGVVQVTVPNDGLPKETEGDHVGLSWDANHARLTPLTGGTR